MKYDDKKGRKWMKMKQPVDYMFLRIEGSGRRRIQVERQNIAGIQVLMVAIPIHKKELLKKRLSEKYLNKLKKRLYRKLRSYPLSACAVSGEEIFQRCLLDERTGFKARKTELLMRGDTILKYLRLKGEKNKRQRLLVYVESRNWKESELYEIIWMAMNDYEDVVISCEDFAGFADMAGKLFEESGLMVSFIDMQSVKMEHFDCVIFLVWEWGDRYREGMDFERAYVVAEQDNSLNKIRRMKRESKEGRRRDNRECYSGLCYECNKKKISYQMAVDLLYQKPDFCEKIGISSVAIYSLECYNKEK